MKVRKIREDLGRARACLKRNETPRALYLIVTAFKETGTNPPMDLRGDFRETITALAKDEDFRREYPGPLAYQPGSERELCNLLIKIYKSVQGQEKQEDYETTLQRKLGLDHCLKEGRALLAQGKASEADAVFMDGLKNFRNEQAVFGLMAKAHMDAGEYVRALGYIKKGLSYVKDDPALLELGQICLRKREEMKR